MDVLAIPRFHREQKVNFVGGTGKIKNYQLEAKSWMYLVEMDLGPEPEMGRVGYETMIWLPEADFERCSQDLAIA